MKKMLSKLVAALALTLALPALAAPTVSLTAPTNGNLYLAPATFAVKANASASGVGINRVEFYANGVLINTDTTSPYQFDWTGVSAGTYSITAKAVDNNGAETTSAARSVTVSGTNSPPTVSLSAPADGARYLNPSSINLSASAAGPELNDLLQRVDFYINGTLTGTATSAPYTFSWSSPAPGSHSVTAVAVDTQGASTTSAARTITVSSQNQPPTVSIVTPIDSSRWHSPANFMFQANASSGEANDTVTVEFYVNGVLQGSDSTSPYSINLSSLGAGTYTLMARAIDGQSASTDSVTRTITVSDTNAAPTVTISAPTNNANYPTAPAAFTINATAGAGEVNGSVAKVEFYINGNLVNTDTAGPWSYAVSGLANGAYTLTAKAFDQLDASATSASVTVTVGPQPKMYFLHVDHLNTPRLVANASQQVVWRWDQLEPFGADAPDDNPAGLGIFEFTLRFPGQYLDKETNLRYNVARDFDPSSGRYLQSDPIGLLGGINTYAYANSDPIAGLDETGLAGTSVLPVPRGGGIAGALAGLALSALINSQVNRGRPGDCWLYHLKDCHRDIVYIGITNNLDRREREHNYAGIIKRYSCRKCPIRMDKENAQHFTNRVECENEERRQIRELMPIFNTAGNPDPEVGAKRMRWVRENCCE